MKVTLPIRSQWRSLSLSYLKRRWNSGFKRKGFRLFLLLLSFVFVLLVSIYNPVTGLKRTEILWDTYGIPHIYGKDVKSLFHAFGWAQMQSHGNLLLRLYGQARGQASEYWGQKYLESDQWIRTMGVPARAHEWYKLQNPKFRSYLDAFAAGINAYAQAHAELIDDEVEVVLPVNAADVLAHLQQVLHFTFVVNPQSVKHINNQQHAANIAPLPVTGSNGWAIAPSRSASGNAMLLANPHLPWSDLFLWYEAQLTAPDFDAYGAALVGIPVLSIAFNDYLGWTHTVNTHDGWDAYELTLTGEGYQLDGKMQAFTTETQILKVKQENHTWHQEPFRVRRSVHGPVIAEERGKAIALRVVGLEQPGALEQWWEMASARNLAEFEATLQRLQIPMFTVMYADRDGHIMHFFNGQVPVRSGGNFADWAGIIPGDTSTNLWTKTHPYQDLPRVLDPPSGWLQNANDPPWTTTFPLAIAPEDYPPYIAPRGPMEFRAQRSARMLIEDKQISFEEMVKYKHSTRMELADRLLDDLIPVARQEGSELARRAVNVLDAWDRRANPNSRGAVLFAFWAEAIDFDNLFATLWDENSPRTTPDGLANPTSALASLEAAATKVETAYGALDVPWSEVFRLRYDDIDLPANGAAGYLGVFRVLEFAASADERFQPIQGDSYVAAIEFSNPIRARVLTSYGNATQPGSPHSSDQLKLFARQELRPVWRERQEIEANLAASKVF